MNDLGADARSREDAGEVSVEIMGFPETFKQTQYYRWAVCQNTPPKLQVAWQGSAGTIMWKRVETCEVTREEYDK